MTFKCSPFVITVIITVLHNSAKQHYIPPPDPCIAAKICNHTGLFICGIEKETFIKRLFLDDCDMFEYNCDYHKDYFKIDSEKCSSNETGLTSTIKAITALNISTLEKAVATENKSEIVNTSVKETVSKPISDNVITTSDTSSTKVTCSCPIVTCPPFNITTITSLHNANLTVSSTSSPTITATSALTSTEATTTLTSTEATTTLTSTEATTTLTSTEATTTLTSTEAMTILTSTEVTTSLTSTEATTTLTSTDMTIISTGTLLTTGPLKTLLNATKTDSVVTTCTSSNSKLSTASSLLTKTPKNLMTSTNLNMTEYKEVVNTIAGKDTVTTQVTCNMYPKHCNRPSTWDTTSKGETSDFFQILRLHYGNRIKLLRDTTHYPQRIAKHFNNDEEGFQFGYHNES